MSEEINETNLIEKIRSKLLTLKHFLTFQKIKDKSTDILKHFLVELENYRVNKFTIEIEPGIGGKESNIWAQDIQLMYKKYFDSYGIISINSEQVPGMHKLLWEKEEIHDIHILCTSTAISNFPLSICFFWF